MTDCVGNVGDVGVVHWEEKGGCYGEAGCAGDAVGDYVEYAEVGGDGAVGSD